MERRTRITSSRSPLGGFSHRVRVLVLDVTYATRHAAEVAAPLPSVLS